MTEYRVGERFPGSPVIGEGLRVAIQEGGQLMLIGAVAQRTSEVERAVPLATMVEDAIWTIAGGASIWHA